MNVQLYQFLQQKVLRKHPLLYTTLCKAYQLVKGYKHPDVVVIENIRCCTRKCEYCPNAHYSRPNMFMSGLLHLDIVYQLKAWEFGGVIQFGVFGEPLLDSCIISRIESLRDTMPNCIIKINTNGDLLTAELANRLTQAGCNAIVVSLHEPRSFDEICELNEIARLFPIVSLTKLPEECRGNRGGMANGKPLSIDSCMSYLRQLIIDADGSILICANDFCGSVKLGHVKEGIENVWNGMLKRMREELKDQTHYAVCKLCREEIE